MFFILAFCMEKIVGITNPEIIDFLDYRAFLSEKFEYLAQKNKKFSRRWIAKKAGIQSPQLISMILKGTRNLTKEIAASLAYALELSDEEEDYLLLLIDLQDSKMSDRREDILQQIRSQFQGGLFTNLQRDDIEYLSKWYYQVVREATGLKNEMQIKNSLGLSKREIKSAHEFLCELGLLKMENGNLVKSSGSTFFQDHICPLPMMKYHFEMISRALDELKVKKENQYFETLTVAIPSKKIPELKKRIHKFICEVDTWLEEENGQDNIIQLNTHFYTFLKD